jgi:hypothetical protein
VDDEEYECPLWWQAQVSQKELDARMAAAAERAEEETQAQRERREINQRRWDEFKDVPNGRNWAIWREYKAGGTTLEKVANNFGVTRERVRQAVAKIDRGIRTVLNRGMSGMWDNVPDEYREGTLGVEFVFKNELVFDDWDERKGWEKVDPYGRGRRYFPPTPEWRSHNGLDDTRPAIPPPVHTYYKTIIEKEQTDERI